MTQRKLPPRMRNSARDVRFTDLLVLVEAHGFEQARFEGSRRLFKHPKVARVLNPQPWSGGKASRARWMISC